MNTLRLPKAQFILLLVLPLAVILGYFVVDPMDPSSITVLALVLGALAIPVVMRWYHPMLILGWNSTIAFTFLPGNPHLWLLLSFAGITVAILNRSISSGAGFISVKPITWSLVFLLLVMFVTAFLNGGIGSQVLGSAKYGGRRYVYITMAVMGYLAFTSQRIPPRRASFYVCAFVLASMTAMVPDVLGLMGVRSSLLYLIFPPDFTAYQAVTGIAQDVEMFRIFGLTGASTAIFCALIAKYGLRGIFDLTKPWRLGLFLLAICAGVYSGFRGMLVSFALIFCVQFYMEGLHRTRWLAIMCGVGLLVGSVIVTEAERLPLVMQRAISFLPVRISPVAQASAEASSEWRLKMWKSILPTIPDHLLLGKGFAINPDDLYFSADMRNHSDDAWALVAGDYHNGPLSLVIPLGIWGVLAFGLFCWFSIRYLYVKFRFGDPSLHKVNTFLFALFTAKLIFWLFVFGGFWSDLYQFTGLIGLSVSINGPEMAPKPDVQDSESSGDLLNPAYQDDYA